MSRLPSLFTIKTLTCRKRSVINNAEKKEKKNAVPFHCYFGPIKWIPLFSDKKEPLTEMQRTQTNKHTDNQSLSSLKVAAEFILQMKKILSGWCFQDTQATANEHLLNVSVCNGCKCKDLTLSVNSKSVHLLISVCLMSCVSAGRINRVFHLDDTTRLSMSRATATAALPNGNCLPAHGNGQL